VLDRETEVMRRLLLGLGCLALCPASVVTSADAQMRSAYGCPDGSTITAFSHDPVVVHDSRDNHDHTVLFAVIGTVTQHPDGCHLVFQSAVLVTTAPADPLPYAKGPPVDGATLKLRVWVCGIRHPEYDVSYVSGSTNDAKSPPTRDVNYGRTCWPQADNYGSEAHAQAWTPAHSVSSYASMPPPQ
jgi:hypothetical protein